MSYLDEFFDETFIALVSIKIIFKYFLYYYKFNRVSPNLFVLPILKKADAEYNKTQYKLLFIIRIIFQNLIFLNINLYLCAKFERGNEL
jgi:hypothetical protein